MLSNNSQKINYFLVLVMINIIIFIISDEKTQFHENIYLEIDCSQLELNPAYFLGKGPCYPLCRAACIYQRLYHVQCDKSLWSMLIAGMLIPARPVSAILKKQTGRPVPDFRIYRFMSFHDSSICELTWESLYNWRIFQMNTN